MRNSKEIVFGKIYISNDCRFWTSDFKSMKKDSSNRYYVLVERYNKILKSIYHNVKGDSLNFIIFEKYEKEMFKSI